MSALSIQPTFPIFTETDGLPLENGYIWIGAANLDPQGNPINVYWDAALTIPAGQPIRTLNGYPSRNGTPARLYVNSNYSIRVQNSKGSLVYGAPVATERYSAALIGFIGFKGQAGTVEDLADDDGADWIGYTPSGVDAEPLSVQDKLRESVSLWDFIPQSEWAALKAGTSTYDCFNAMTNAIDTGKSIDIRDGTFPISNKLFPESNTAWFGDRSGVLKWTTVNCLIDARSIGNWTMDGIVVDGNYTAYTPVDNSQTPWGVRLESSNNITIVNNVFTRLFRIGVCVGHESTTECRNVIIDSNVIHDIGYFTDPTVGFGNGVAVLSASNVKITNNWIYNITGNTSGTSGINCEPGNATYVCSDIEIAFNKVTNCDDCPGIGLYQPVDFSTDRSNINIHDNTIKVTGTAPGIRCEQFGYTYIRDNFLEQTPGILVKRYKANKVYIEGNEIRQSSGASAYGIRIQDGIAGAVITRNRLRNINGTAISVDMFDFEAALSAKDCLIQDNVMTSVSDRAIEISAGNFVISGNTMIGCAITSGDFYLEPLLGGASTSVNGYIGGNTFVTFNGSIVAFINAEGDLMNNVQIGTNSYVGPISPTQKTQTFNIGGRVPGVFMDVLPAAGTWKVGDIIWKATPAAAGFIGWVCTTGGTPGTWKTFGTIQA
jgi:hypothetical protein